MDLGSGIAISTGIISGTSIFIAGIAKWGDSIKNGNSPITKEVCQTQHKALERLLDEKFSHMNDRMDQMLSVLQNFKD